MTFDFIDMIVNTGDEYLTGVFYKRRPISPTDGGITFKYKQLDPNARVFDKLLGELRKDRETYAINTKNNCGFNIGGYIQTQNGKLWEITEVIGNEEVKGGNEVLRWFKTAKNAEISIRMIQVDDLYNIHNVYEKNCIVRLKSEEKMVKVSYDGADDIVNGLSHEISLKKGMGAIITITFENGNSKQIVVSAHKTVANELNYKV